MADAPVFSCSSVRQPRHLAAARALYGDDPEPQTDAGRPAAAVVGPGVDPGRWLTLPSLDRLVSYDSPSPCTGSCNPGLIDWTRTGVSHMYPYGA
ncbi:hypothetical protein ACIA8F_24065 [Streptomyces sp. NPDC051563]|uniref:hypothetical protein n=1 Tax=Streptomyces sp. NPDC051563 TaxID=3365659 RepID=UPI0037B953AA